MWKSLGVALVTFAALGVYYDLAREESESVSRLTLRQAQTDARTCALAGINAARLTLADSWMDRRVAGREVGGTYRAVSSVKGERAAIRSVGAIELETRALSCRLRVDIFRRKGDEGGFQYVTGNLSEG